MKTMTAWFFKAACGLATWQTSLLADKRALSDIDKCVKTTRLPLPVHS